MRSRLLSSASAPLSPKPDTSLQPTLARGLFELGHGGDPELLIDRPRLAGPEARDLEQRRQRARKLASQAFVELHLAGGQVLDDLGFERRADARQFAQPTRREQHVHALARAADAARGHAVRVVAIRLLAFHFQDVADLREEPGDFSIHIRARLDVFRHATLTLR